MNVALIGATGRTGAHVLARLLQRGHHVTALVRTPAKLPSVAAAADGLTVQSGDVLQAGALERLIDGAEAVVSALGPVGRQADLHTRTAQRLVALMSEHGPRRFVGISGAGVDAPGDDKSRQAKIISFLIQRLGGAAVADKPAELAVWLASGLDWTLVRPPRLLDGAPTGRIDHHAHRSVPGTTITRADLAAFVVEVVEQGLYARAAPFVAGAVGGVQRHHHP
ncbi:NAD(P)-dependent oxidoreductase [Planobispora siamensis]|uniref:NmrA family transcriptional regulator n=1 Tax=Planobispora siamensis TaxID=936338 RepID=A0A8J3SUQ1_9ACTN|nr:NAD(P)H-binding protein [Planobispora siamensis]GIH95953.1 NmrA family transcriptional regulator [Planobispora siamensis]